MNAVTACLQVSVIVPTRNAADIRRNLPVSRNSIKPIVSSSALAVPGGSLLGTNFIRTLQMCDFSIQEMQFDAKQVEIGIVEHFSFVGSEATQQLSSVHDELADCPANVHDAPWRRQPQATAAAIDCVALHLSESFTIRVLALGDH